MAQLCHPRALAKDLLGALGRLARELEAEEKQAGSHAVAWDGRDASGGDLPSGVYFCRLEAGRARATKKVILVR